MVRSSLHRLANGLMALLRRHPPDQNVGERLLEWPRRSELAAGLLAARLPAAGARVADYGCGRQTLRRFLPAGWSYTPYDWHARSADTIVVDFDRERPEERFDAIACLGVLEYLEDPVGLLRHAIAQAPVVVFSYNGPTTAARRRAQGWRNDLPLDALESAAKGSGARVEERVPVGDNEWLYLVRRGPLA